MARYSYERLSAQDAAFLFAERPNEPMHVGAVAIFDGGTTSSDLDGVDIEKFRQTVEGVLHWIPRYRQKLEWTPLESWPIWVDDRQFDIGHHIRHIALPRPGSFEQLTELVGRINSRPLDRRHPLWEIWVIEGVAEGSQFALLNKIHHCMIDGAGGADLSQILLSPSPKSEIGAPMPFMPRPIPRRSELVRDSLSRGIRRSLDLVKDSSRRSTSTSDRSVGLGDRFRAIREVLRYAIRPACDTPINGSLGPHRRFEWLAMPLDDVRELRKVLGCTINDVVLATVAGAMRRYLFRRRVDHRMIDFRIAAPVSTRQPGHDHRHGNHVSTWIVPLPLELEDPLERLEAITETTRQLKDSKAELALDTLMEVAEWLPTPLLAIGTRAAQAPAHMVVTNVHGPQFPLYIMGSRLLGMYPIVPLLPGSGLGVALFSYEGKLCWGFNGDSELVPDLGLFVEDIGAAFEELRGAAVKNFMDRRTAAPESDSNESTSVEGAGGAMKASDLLIDPCPSPVEPVERLGEQAVHASG